MSRAQIPMALDKYDSWGWLEMNQQVALVLQDSSPKRAQIADNAEIDVKPMDGRKWVIARLAANHRALGVLDDRRNETIATARTVKSTWEHSLLLLNFWREWLKLRCLAVLLQKKLLYFQFAKTTKESFWDTLYESSSKSDPKFDEHMSFSAESIRKYSHQPHYSSWAPCGCGRCKSRYNWIRLLKQV